MSLRIMSVIVVTLCCLQRLEAQTDPAPADGQPASAAHRWLQDYFLEAAKKYEFFLDDAKSKPLALVEKPIFRWRQDDDWTGDVFVWTYLGRPEVVGCMLASSDNGGSRSVGHEFHTLASTGLPRTKTISGFWQPKTGLNMIPLNDVELPAKTAALRLPQMRTLARDFNVVMKNDDKDWELRLLPQPIYRYSAPDRGVIDGGLFAYVWTRGTDPEFLLMLECRDDQSSLVWTYLPVEFTVRSLRLTFKEREVWTSAGGGSWISGESTRSYETFRARSVKVPVK